MREVDRLLAYRRQLYQAMRVGVPGLPGNCCVLGLYFSALLGTACPSALHAQAVAAPRCLAVTVGGRDGRHTQLVLAVSSLPLGIHTGFSLPLQEAEAAEETRQAEQEARQAAIVQAERQRILREAAHLKGYLPKGVVQVRACGEVGGVNGSRLTHHAGSAAGADPPGACAWRRRWCSAPAGHLHTKQFACLFEGGEQWL